MRFKPLIMPVAVLASCVPGAAATITLPPPPAQAQSKPVPPPLASAMKDFVKNSVEGKFAPRDRPPRSTASQAKVCSVPLIEVLPQQSRNTSRMPKFPARSLDQNQVAPPAPPCTADNRIRPKRPGSRSNGPGPRFIPLGTPASGAVHR
jgi:hypothetical protein